MKIKKSFLFPIVYKLACIKKIKEKKVVFVVSVQEQLTDSLHYVYRYFSEDPQWEVSVHLLKNKSVSEKEYIMNCCKMLKDIATAKYVFLEDQCEPISLMNKRPGTYITQLWHACGAFKKFGWSVADKEFGASREQQEKHPPHKNYDLVTVSSPEVVWAYEEAMMYKPEQSVVQPLGVSRTDIFFDDRFKAEAEKKVKELFPSASGKKIILYAPTFRGNIASAKAPQMPDLNMAYKLLGDEYVFIIKQHPFVKELPEIPYILENVFAYDATGAISTEELLCVADICITDYSSIIFEYSLFEKPIIFYAYDLYEYVNERNFFYYFNTMLPGPILSTSDQLVDCIKQIDKTFDASRIIKFREKFMSSCDGHSTRRIINYILNKGQVFDNVSPITAETRDGIDTIRDNYVYKASVVIPVYNKGEYLKECINSLISQNEDIAFEILLIDDGSSDESIKIEKEYADKYNFIKLIPIEHGGVSKARNRGIKEASGKYILFLDADDSYSPGVIRKATDYFDRVYDETDCVVLRVSHYVMGKPIKPHFRYMILTHTGIYDLNDFPFAFNTTINIVVKNNKKVMFDTDLEFGEDQKYNWDIVKEKLKIGYCAEAEYIYNRNTSSAVMTRRYAINIFEPFIKCWKSLLKEYHPGEAPKALQAMIMTEMMFRLEQNCLFPYSYRGQRRQKAISEVQFLLNNIDTDIIMNHPRMAKYHKFYWVNWKTNVKKELLLQNDQALVLVDNQILLSETKINIAVKKVEIEDGIFELFGVLESGLFNYIPETRPRIIADINGKRLEVEVFDSAESCYRSKTRTNYFYGFRFQFPADKNFSLKFIVEIGINSFGTFLSGRRYKRTKKTNRILLLRNGKIIEIDDELITVRNASVIESGKVRYLNSEGKSAGAKAYRVCSAALRRTKKRIWLYNDSAAIKTDNAFLQFQHDWKKKDGIDRYYVFDGDISDYLGHFTPDQHKNLVEFGSKKHKILYLSAEYVLTSFSDQKPKCPFSNVAMRDYSDIRGPEIIYLQHGVCLPDIRWLQSAESNKADKIVVSAEFERENYVSMYNYKPEDLLPFGMARYDIVDRDAKPQNRILFAPSWRAYFVSSDSAHREVNNYVFENTNYYKNFMRFLNSPELSELLEKYDFTLDLRLHQNMRKGLENISFSSDRIRMADLNEHIENYKVFITDFSTFAFDFVYLKRAIMYFIPDITEVRSGMHTFRDFGLPFEEWYGDVTFNPEDALKALEKLLEQGAIPEEKYRQRMDDCFLPFEKPREGLYQFLYRNMQ